MRWLKNNPLPLGSLVVSLLLVSLSFLGEQGLWRIFFLRNESVHMRENVMALRQENLNLRRDLARARLDPLATERLAREQLGFGRPYDRVYIFK